ncbi:hypothetical protein ACFOEE_06415 [Pseudoalteromonas fenneropenaei]|uniref:Uncharacterized protein n=1 Tax=Pseudoalteromonas fenneropenaei TaxID=1737459 RepID=A0ABV7CHX9_9GAMM
MQYLAHINATGSCLATFATALENHMYFAEPSPFMVQYDSSLTAPVMRVTIPELDDLDRESRLLLLLQGLIQDDSVSTLLNSNAVQKICFITPHEFGEPVLGDALLESLLRDNKVAAVSFSQQPSLTANTLVLGTLVLCADSTVGAEQILAREASQLQVLDGPLGKIPGEGACAFFVGGQTQVTEHAYAGALHEQLQAANATADELYLFGGTPNEAWQYHWYAASQKIYQAEDAVIEMLDPNVVCGHTGVCQPWMNLVAAIALLRSPFHRARQRVLMLDNDNNAQLIEYARSK